METRILTIDLGVHAYDIYIGAGLLSRLENFLPDEIGARSVFIVTDSNVEQYALEVKKALEPHASGSMHVLTLPAGEKTKSFETVEKTCAFMLENGLNRNSLVLAVGGGVIGDLTGFCASIVMRGVPYIQIPTTLLSQVDSSVGGKTGINTAQGKNLIGSFYQPGAVIADIGTLKTLPTREIIAGYAEVVKYGLIQDAAFFEWLEEHGRAVCALEEEAVIRAVEVSCQAKARMVEADEKERGKRALLNLGHTFGHALEAEAGYNGTLLHGEAVAIGMVMAFDLSYRMGLCPREDLERVERHLKDIGFRIRASFVDGLSTSVERLIDVMRRDKKVMSGKMVFILARGIGEAFISSDVPEDLVREVLEDSLGGPVKEEQTKCSTKFSSLS